jgi:Replication-relaxation
VSSLRPGQPRLPAIGVEVLVSLAEHRALSTAQVAEVHLPGRSLRRAQQLLASLAEAGLAAHSEAGEAPRRVWHLSEAGVGFVRDSGVLDREPRAPSEAEVIGPLRAHTLAVNDAAICFLRAARERGDEFGALSWRHEVAHPLNAGRGRRRRTLIADAVLSYLRVEEDEVVLEQRFLELDRATLSVDRLAAELGRYAVLCAARDPDGEPLWRSRYPSFPAVVCVLCGASRPALERRRDVVLALLASDPGLARTREPHISICLLDDLREQGPFAPIFRRALRPETPVDWLGRRAR